MSQQTVYKESDRFSKSVGAGMKSVFGGGSKTYYVLEHKSTSNKYRAGQTQEIIVDYIELGRDKKCQVSYGDLYPTVSRKHAGITKDGNNWTLKHYGKNPTLINGKAVAKQWYLQNGDEIQLSYEGPKIGFLIPGNNIVGSIGFSKRLSLFGQQALRPYKQVLAALSTIFLLAIAGLSYFIWDQGNQIQRQVEAMTEMTRNAQVYEGNIDSLKSSILNDEVSRRALQNEVDRLKNLVAEIPETIESISGNIQRPEATLSFDNLFPSVYFITVDKVKVSFGGSVEELTDYRWSGTGFLLNDKRFVTARHVTESWYFFEEPNSPEVAFNRIASNGGTVVAYFTAYSPDGSVLRFTSDDFNTDRSGDQNLFAVDPRNGTRITLSKASLDDGKDWSVLVTNKTGNIEADTDRSNRLNQQDKLHILGYPLGLGAWSTSDISPIYGNCIVSANGLSNGVIYVTDRNFEQGNSGGPVFYRDNDKYVAVGIVSAGTGGSTGLLVPISTVQ